MGASSSENESGEGGMVIAIDGPAGSGKSTAARRLAERLGGRLLETGALYRCVALKARQMGIPVDDPLRVAPIAGKLKVRFESAPSGEGTITFLDGQDVTAQLREPQVSRDASVVASLGEVRKSLLSLQRELARGGVTVAEGRDLGTVVFPDAAVKFFVTADPEVRAQRRHLEQVESGDRASLDQVRSDIEARDARDRTRKVAPMTPAEDAVVLDTSRLDPEAVVTAMVAEVKRRTGNR
jgi:cytidylate kinase